MKQDHKVPTQTELEGYIAQAKLMRAEAIVSLGKRLFHLPGDLVKYPSQPAATK